MSSLAALLFFTDMYALLLGYYEIVNFKSLYRSLPLLFIIPIGVSLGTRLFKDSSRNDYKKYVLYFLIIISFFGLAKFLI